LLLYGQTQRATFIDRPDNLMYTPFACVASVVKDGSVKAQALINKYYRVLQNNMLIDMRLIEDAEFYLTPQDIEEFDPFVPVYIEHFGAYFYVNKIKNFVSNQLTKCDLIKI
jgi:hypothetical protein